jgi:hypothetical protein
MIPKKMNGRVYGAYLTAAEQRAMDMEINRQIVMKDEQYEMDLDALILYALMRHKGWKKVRLHNFWKDFIIIHKELRDYYQMNRPGDIEWFAHRELKAIGVDIHQWYEEENLNE